MKKAIEIFRIIIGSPFLAVGGFLIFIYALIAGFAEDNHESEYIRPDDYYLL